MDGKVHTQLKIGVMFGEKERRGVESGKIQKGLSLYL